MNIELRIDPSRARRWHADLIERLDRSPALHVARIAFAPAHPAASSVELLLTLERLVLARRRRPHAADKLDPAALKPSVREASVLPDLVIDLGGDNTAVPAEKRVLRPLFDGCPGEDAIFAALLSGRMPTIAVTDGATDTVLAAGVASGECARGIADGLEAVVARLILMLEACAHGRGLHPPEQAIPAKGGLSGFSPLRMVGRHAARTVAFKAARALYGLCRHSPHWRLGWRRVEGDGVWERLGLEGPAWQEVPDPGFAFYADPVPIVWRGRTFVFFEELDHATEKGVISTLEFGPGGPIGEVRRVLEEPWHLSYPFLIEHAGDIWMIPESSLERTVSLYRAIDFPNHWRREATLLSGIVAGDATVIVHDGRFWMFTATQEGGGGYSDTLSLFSAPDLFGPWIPHADNPIMIDRAAARPAGNVVMRGGRLWRPVQDCTDRYGGALGLAEILRLDEGGFEQAVRAVLRPGPLWPGRRLHTLNRAGNLEFIDGSAAPFKFLSRRPQVPKHEPYPPRLPEAQAARPNLLDTVARAPVTMERDRSGA